MILSYSILAEAVKKEMEAVGSIFRYAKDEPFLLHPGIGCQEGDGGCRIPYPSMVTLEINLPYCTLAEAVKKR